jgi:hypothetical protein
MIFEQVRIFWHCDDFLLNLVHLFGQLLISAVGKLILNGWFYRRG